MKRLLIHKLIAFFTIFSLWTVMSCENERLAFVPEIPVIMPIYDNVWGTIYHAEVRQCDATPTITGDGSRINPYKASEHRWIAISQEMLDSEWRVELLNDSTSLQFKGKIQYGDTIWVDSPYTQINGWWIVRDTKNKRYQNSIDFLQTKGDADLYNNDKYWNGRFDSIKIYDSADARLLGFNAMT
jgi:hypothetical protein